MMRLALLLVGSLVVFAALWFRAIRKMTVDLTVMWGILGILLVLAGSITPLAEWIRDYFAETKTAVFVLGSVGLLIGFQFSLVLSRLQMKNQELTIEVSLLKQEMERILNKLETK